LRGSRDQSPFAGEIEQFECHEMSSNALVLD
jgi:hypothetical protein